MIERLRLTVSEKTFQKALSVFKENGMSLDEAMDLFIARTARDNKLPIGLTPNDEILVRLCDIAHGRDSLFPLPEEGIKRLNNDLESNNLTEDNRTFFKKPDYTFLDEQGRKLSVTDNFVSRQDDTTVTRWHIEKYLFIPSVIFDKENFDHMDNLETDSAGFIISYKDDVGRKRILGAPYDVPKINDLCIVIGRELNSSENRKVIPFLIKDELWINPDKKLYSFVSYGVAYDLYLNKLVSKHRVVNFDKFVFIQNYDRAELESAYSSNCTVTINEQKRHLFINLPDRKPQPFYFTSRPRGKLTDFVLAITMEGKDPLRLYKLD